MASNYKEMNIDDIVKGWASQQNEAVNDYDETDGSDLSYHIDYSRVKFDEDEPVFQQLVHQGVPKSEVIYETIFKNDTNRDQKFSLKTVRETTSLARFNLSTAMVVDEKTKLGMSKLPQQIPKSAGFDSELSLERIAVNEIKEKLAWHIDTYVDVTRGSSTKASVIINEKSYEAQFTVRTTIYGNIHVDIVDPDDNNSLHRSLDGDIVKILKHYNTGASGLSFHNGKAIYTSQGVCKFRYGVDQNVDLKTIN